MSQYFYLNRRIVEVQYIYEALYDEKIARQNEFALTIIIDGFPVKSIKYVEWCNGFIERFVARLTFDYKEQREIRRRVVRTPNGLKHIFTLREPKLKKEITTAIKVVSGIYFTRALRSVEKSYTTWNFVRNPLYDKNVIGVISSFV